MAEIATEKIIGIINRAIAKSPFRDSHIKDDNKNSISFSEVVPNVIQFNDAQSNPIINIFKNAAKSRIKKGVFYHFKSYEIAKEIIKNKIIQVSSLGSNSENDFAEYSEFYKRMGIILPFIPENYSGENKHELYINQPIESNKEDIFILCFTDNPFNERFWSDYVDNGRGVCLKFEISDFKQDGINKLIYDFRDVYYDEGYAFDFINEINFKLKKEFQKVIFLEGLDKFAKFYKRGNYRWEKETRLVFSKNPTNPLFPDNIENYCEIKTAHNKRRYIELPILGNINTNPFFKLKLEEIICGQNINQNQITELESLINANLSNCKISTHS